MRLLKLGLKDVCFPNPAGHQARAEAGEALEWKHDEAGEPFGGLTFRPRTLTRRYTLANGSSPGLVWWQALVDAGGTGRRHFMTTLRSRYSAEETARRGDALYERMIRGKVESAHRGKVVAIDIDREEYVIADNALTASERLLAQHPDAEIWCVRVGSRVLHRIGGFPSSSSVKVAIPRCARELP